MSLQCPCGVCLPSHRLLGGARSRRRHTRATRIPCERGTSWRSTTVRTLRLSDAQAARLYAMVNVAMFDAVNGILTRGGRRREPASRAGAGRHGAGARRPRRRGSRRGPCRARRRASVAGWRLRRSNCSNDLASGHDGRVGLDWGASVGAEVRALRTADGSTPNESQPGSDAPGQFPRLVVGRAVSPLEAVRDCQRVSLRGVGPAGTRQPSVRQRLRGGESAGQCCHRRRNGAGDLHVLEPWGGHHAAARRVDSSGARGDNAVAAAAAGDDAAVRPARHGAERYRRAHGDDEVRVSLLASGDGDPRSSHRRQRAHRTGPGVVAQGRRHRHVPGILVGPQHVQRRWCGRARRVLLRRRHSVRTEDRLRGFRRDPPLRELFRGGRGSRPFAPRRRVSISGSAIRTRRWRGGRSPRRLPPRRYFSGTARRISGGARAERRRGRITKQSSRRGVRHVPETRRPRAHIHGGDHPRRHRLPPVARRSMGRAVLASQGLHPGVERPSSACWPRARPSSNAAACA